MSEDISSVEQVEAPSGDNQPAKDPPEGYIPEQRYNDLRKKLDEQGAELNRLKNGGETDNGDMFKKVEQRGIDSTEDLLRVTGLDGAQIAEQFSKNGSLTEEQYEAFKTKAGLGKGVVDAYLRAEQANAAMLKQTARAALEEEAGGKEALDQLVEFANRNYDEETIAKYNKHISSGDIDVSKMVIKAIALDFQKKHPGSKGANIVEPSSVGNAPGGTLKPFATKQEQNAAFNDKRFTPPSPSKPNPDFDPAYHQQVLNRMNMGLDHSRANTNG